jgi:hypothetical protein
MSATARQASGKPEVRASYECDEGTRRLVAQRIEGRVALIDIPVGDVGRVYLVERDVTCMAELEGLEADYLALATELGRPPLRGDWILG